MTIFSATVEDYLFLDETVQGNVNVAGLVYESVVEDGIACIEAVYFRWTELVDESLSFADSFTASHEPYCYLEDPILIEERSGMPVRMKGAELNIVHSPLVAPISCCFIELDVLHGIDIFYQEVSDALHILDLSIPANVHDNYCYESLNIAMENIPEFKIYACYKVVKMATSDHLNMRHSVVQEYYFNSKAFDYFFAYDKYAWGWDKYLADNFDITLWLKGAYGRSVYESFTPKLGLLAAWTGQQELSERFMAYDQAIFEKFYAKVVEESLGLAVSMDVDSRMMHMAIESLALGETPILEVQRFLQAVESLAITQAASVTFGHCPEVVESLDLANSPELLRVIPQVLVDVAELLDDPVSKWLALCLLQETINDSDKAIR